MFIFNEAYNMTTPECISLHVGKAGVYLGHSIWDFLCEEQGVMTDGTANHMKVHGDRHGPNTKFFDVDDQGKHAPRALFVDLDPTEVDRLRNSFFDTLFSPDQLISSTKGADKNYAAGRHAEGKKVVELVMEGVRRQAEACDKLQDFLIYNSVGGGTGAGFTALMLERMSRDYGKKGKLQYAVADTSDIEKSTTETYNHVFHAAATVSLSDLVVLFDNASLVSRCQTGLGVAEPRYATLNQIIAHVVSSTTLPMRNGDGHHGVKQLTTELVPHVRLRYPVASLAPITFEKYVDNEKSDNLWKNAECARQAIDDMTRSCFDPRQTLVEVNVGEGKSMAVTLLYRGDIKDTMYLPEPVEALRADPLLPTVTWLRPKYHYRHDNFCDPPPSLKMTTVLGSRAQTVMVPHKRSLCVLNNNTAVVNVWNRLLAKYEGLLESKSLAHLYTAEGMEEGDFEGAREYLKSLTAEYNSVDF